jgi:hypothetical protein
MYIFVDEVQHQGVFFWIKLLLLTLTIDCIVEEYCLYDSTAGCS